MTEEHAHPDPFANLRSRAEEKVHTDEAQAGKPYSPEEARRLLHELEVHQIELEMQNEELRRAQGELEVSRARYFDLFDLAPVGYFTLSEKGLILEANFTGAGLLGVGRCEVVKQPLSHFILPEDQDIYYRHRRQLLETGTPQACELRLMKQAGDPFWARLETTVVQDGDRGSPVCRVVLSDITERKRTAEEIAQSRQRLAGIVESAMDAIITVDDQQRIVLFNRAAENMFRCPAAQALGSPVGRFIPERFRQSHAEHVQQFGHTGQTNRAMGHLGAVSGLRADGEEFPSEASISQVEVGGRKLFSVILRDMTERKRGEEELRHAKQGAETANAAKSQFLANMSHEIRTPMNAILGMTNLALSEEMSPSVRDSLQTAQESANLLLDLLNQVLDLSRIEAGRFELESTPFGLRKAVEQVLKTIRVSTGEKGLELLCEIPAEVPDRLIGDALRLRQVLLNLVANAVKFTHQGRIMVRVAIESQAAEEIRLRFSVADTGIGISPADQQRVFAPFTQADASTTRHYGGSGLGLAISQSLAGLMGGRMWVESQPGHGSTFFFTARFQQQSQPMADGLSHEHAVAEARSGTPVLAVTPQSPLRILLVEDTPANQKLVVRILTKRGHVVETANNGQEALDLFKQQDFDAVVMDVQMPVMDGFQATAAIRTWDSSKSRVPIIAMTAHALKGDRERCLDAGMDGYISKPINSRELVELVEHFVDASAK